MAESGASTKALQIVGPDLFVAAWGNGVQVLDISDPSQPRWKRGWNPRQCPVGIHVVGDYAYVANRLVGLTVLFVRNAASPTLIGNVDIGGDAMVVNVAGRYAFVANYPQGFSVVDVQNPARPALLATVALPQAATSIQAAGDYVYLAEPNALRIFSVRDPRRPVQVGKQRVFGPVPRVQMVGDIAFLATGQSGLITLALGNHPNAPEFLDRLMIDNSQLPVLINESPRNAKFVGMAWMLTNAAWRADMQKRHGTNLPRNLEEVVAAIRNSSQYYHYASGRRGIARSLYGLHVTGPQALALAYRDALEIIDVTNPAGPWLAGRIQLTGQTWDVRGANGYAYVMDSGANIHVVDVRRPELPIQVAQFRSDGYASSILALNIADQPPDTPVAPHQNVLIAGNAPELSDPQRQSDGGFSFRLEGEAGGSYLVQASADLVAWTAITTNRLPAIGETRVTDSAAGQFPRRFYRAVRIP